MNIIKEKRNQIIIALCELVVGILLLIEPVKFTSGIIMVLGIIITVAGVINVINHFKTEPAEGIIRQELTIGLVEILAGAFCIFNPGWFITTFTVLTMIYGVATLILGVFKISISIDLARLKNPHWLWHLIGAVITTVCAVIILCNPFGSTAVLWGFVAISLIVEAVADIAVIILVVVKSK